MAATMHNVNISGGIGGPGGAGGHQGGGGGVGQGPTLNFHGNNSIQLGPQPDDYDKIMDFVSPINFHPRQQEIFKTRQKDTGNWLLTHPSFLEWKEGNSQVLWCFGIPGSGKTVLASLVVNHLTSLADPSVGVACVYFNYKESNIQTLENILGAIWRQLAANHNLQSAGVLYQKHSRSNTSIEVEEIQRLLDTTVEQCSKTYVVIDALDECIPQEKDELLDLIQELGVKNHIKLLVTCRPHIVPPKDNGAVLLAVHPPEEDIHHYIMAQIKKNHRLGRFTQDQALRDKILNLITSKAAGMFLFVELQMKLLGQALTKQALLDALVRLPADLNTLYARTLEHIKLDNILHEIGLSALSWVAFAKRPLTVLELRTALAIHNSKPLMPDESSMVGVEDLLEACHGLLIVNTTRNGEVFRLVHYTAQEFMETIQNQEFADIHISISRTLLVCLQWANDSGDFPKECYKPRTKVDSEKHPLLDYSQYVLMHMKGKPELHLQKELLMGASNMKPYPTWTIVPWRSKYRPTPRTPLWVAVAGNLNHLMDKLLDIQDMQGGSALILASEHGYLKYLERLRSGKILASQIELDMALQQACLGGHLEIVNLLVKLGSDVDGICDGDTPLQAAARGGYWDVVQVLLQANADPNLVIGVYETPLQTAVYGKYPDIVQLLLQAGADPNLATGDNETALQAATVQGYRDIIQLLLRANADPNLVGGVHGTALQAATYNGNWKIVQLLLKANADPNLAPEDGQTALQAAAIRGHEGIVQLLLHAGANPNLIGGYHGTALQAASSKGKLDLVELLLTFGANPNLIGGKYGTALRGASAEGHHKVVNCLLQAGANYNFATQYECQSMM